jgi:hypothetical protein
MTGDRWVSLIALAAWLILAVSAWRSRRVSAQRTLQMGTLWLGLFLVVVLVFRMIGQ